MLAIARSGKYNGYLLEGMACPGGCIGGAGVLSDVKKAVTNLEKDKARSTLHEPTQTEFLDYLELITEEDK